MPSMTTCVRLFSITLFGYCALLASSALAAAPPEDATPLDEAAPPAAPEDEAEAEADSEPASDDSDEPAEGSASGSASVAIEGPAVAPQPIEPESEPAVDKASLPWRYRVGIVAQTRERNRNDIPWIKRWAPERLMTELGVFGGVLFPAENHDFYDPGTGYKPLWVSAGGLGLRAAFFPERFIGVEAEGGAFLGHTRTSDNDPVVLWNARGHVVAQLPWWNVTPFVLVGGGGVGVRANPFVLGTDVDPSVHWGGGVKVFLHRYVALRVEGRHVLAPKQATQNSFTSHGEFLAGLTFTLGRAKPLPEPPPDPDRDKDGFLNDRDDCPDTPGVSPDGCPARDSDKDGFVDTEDACIYEAGVEPDGCPIRDQDRDGIPDATDKCIDRPETDNGFEDEDGCPDEIPEEVREFSGVIEGIEFDRDSTEITERSKPTLDRALKVLTDYPDIRIEIVGHTDNEGTTEYNLELSQGRADSVKNYFVAGGVDESRIQTRGAGEKEPLASNDSEEGRAKNRRTEFKILKVNRAQ
jgi:OOP family OmpA-OmpF porin